MPLQRAAVGVCLQRWVETVQGMSRSSAQRGRNSYTLLSIVTLLGVPTALPPPLPRVSHNPTSAGVLVVPSVLISHLTATLSHPHHHSTCSIAGSGGTAVSAGHSADDFTPTLSVSRANATRPSHPLHAPPLIAPCTTAAGGGRSTDAMGVRPTRTKAGRGANLASASESAPRALRTWFYETERALEAWVCPRPSSC